MKNNNCELCNQGDLAITVSCKGCQDSFHLHERQIADVGPGSIILAECPSCLTVNCFLKRGPRLLYPSAPVKVYPGQTILDLREARNEVS